MPTVSGISHLLLDIEGTTCPVNFVVKILFPYAATHLSEFLQQECDNPEVQRLMNEAEQAWQHDRDPDAIKLRRQQLVEGPASHSTRDTPHPAGGSHLHVAPYLQLLIRQDRKLSALKDLQGLIWQAGYGKGALVAPLYADVHDALVRWHGAGVQLAVYSSGSVSAQQLLYGHTQNGDLRSLFRHWFDTRTGAKQASQSYLSICQAMHAQPRRVCFISDALPECEAAHQAGMAVLFSDRPGNPQREPGAFERITNYSDLVIQP